MNYTDTLIEEYSDLNKDDIEAWYEVSRDENVAKRQRLEDVFVGPGRYEYTLVDGIDGKQLTDDDYFDEAGFKRLIDKYENGYSTSNGYWYLDSIKFIG